MGCSTNRSYLVVAIRTVRLVAVVVEEAAAWAVGAGEVAEAVGMEVNAVAAARLKAANFQNQKIFGRSITWRNRMVSGQSFSNSPLTIHYSKLILPHHTLHWAGGRVIVFCVRFGVVHSFDIAFNHKINQLAYGHSGVDAYRLCARDFQCPGIAEAYITFAGSGMDINPQTAGA